METVRHNVKRKLLLEIVTAEIYNAVKRRGAFGRNGFKRKSRKNSPHKNVEVMLLNDCEIIRFPAGIKLVSGIHFDISPLIL